MDALFSFFLFLHFINIFKKFLKNVFYFQLIFFIIFKLFWCAGVKINFFKIKNYIILIHFWKKNTLKNNRYHTHKRKFMKKLVKRTQQPQERNKKKRKKKERKQEASKRCDCITCNCSWWIPPSLWVYCVIQMEEMIRRLHEQRHMLQTVLWKVNKDRVSA